ncbi:MAG: riboflavin kinase [Stictis urceolatum]|nr:riboflavin kinase [Stictis urceolata]
MKHSDPRPDYAGPQAGPEKPFPLRLEGPVVKGFGRGSKELGIPTANLPISGLDIAGNTDLDSGVYFGFASLRRSTLTSQTPTVYPMVMSIGWNPFYKNSVRSVEVHIMHDFLVDFYDEHMKLLILGFVRPELDYVSKEALIEDIRTDIAVAGRSLEREGWKTYKEERWLKES